MYQTIRYAVNTGTGVVGNSLVDNLWYDATGNLIKVKASGSSALQKMQYDGVRRLTKRYVTYDTAETAYADASNVTGDTVFQQEEFTYNEASNLIQQITVAAHEN